MKVKMTSPEIWIQGYFRRFLDCHQCRLHGTAVAHAVGGGAIYDNPILLIGEGPGKEEDEYGQVFIGRSGKVLREGLDRTVGKSLTCYVTNLVVCHPTDSKRGPNRFPQEGNLPLRR